MELMIDHKIRLGRLAFALFLISIAAGAFWEYGLRGAIAGSSRGSHFFL